MKTTLRRIGIISVGRVGFWIGAALSIVNFVILFGFLLLVVEELPPNFFTLPLLARIVIFVVISGVQTAFSFGMFAFIYNMISRNFGGIQLEFDMGASEPVAKAKTGDTNGEEPEIV